MTTVATFEGDVVLSINSDGEGSLVENLAYNAVSADHRTNYELHRNTAAYLVIESRPS